MSGKHKIDVKKTGSIQSGNKTPYCSCGWVGSAWSNQHPDQYQCIFDEMNAHKEKFKKIKSDSKKSEINFDSVLKQRKIEGKPLVLIQPNSDSEKVISALKKFLPEEKQDCVVLIDLTKANAN